MQTEMITDQQRKTLEVCFQKVKADYEQLAPYAIMARIIRIEGIDAHRAIKGYQLMRTLGIIPDEFVRGGLEIEKKILKTYFHPVMCEMITRFGLEMDHMNLTYKPVKPGGEPLVLEKATREEIEQYTKDYREHNKIGIGEDANNSWAVVNRDKARSIGLSLDDDEPIVKQNAIEDVKEVKREITRTILNLDTDF